jgi:hypothetical protein
VNSATPICRDCVHGPQLARYAICSRWPKKPDLVRGEKIARLENCYDERNRGFFDRLYGIDKCGPEGKYFEARPQPAQSDALKMAREALRNIQIEAEREQGSWVHLKRVIALNCKQVLAKAGGFINE